MASNNKCNACEYSALEYSPFLKAWVSSCNQAKCHYKARTSDRLKVIPRDRGREKELCLER